MAAKKRDITSMNIYELLEVGPHATEKEIRRAYRKKALKVHPDKNKDDPKANALFHQLSEALEVLLDPSAKAAYDRVLKARDKAKLRDHEMDAKRRKLKEDLLSREKAAASTTVDAESKLRKSERDFQAEIERLRKEGSRVLEEEQERLRQKLVEDLLAPTEEDDEGTRQLWVYWKMDKKDYTLDDIQQIFHKYGDCHVIFSKKKRGKALIEFETGAAAARAVQFERGRRDGPLKVTYLDGSGMPKTPATRSQPAAPQQPTDTSFDDFEAQVLGLMMKNVDQRQGTTDEASNGS